VTAPASGPELRASGPCRTLLRPGPGADLGVARGEGPLSLLAGAALVWLLVEGGDGELALDDVSRAVAGRGDVFEGPGWSAVAGPGATLELRGGVRWTATWRAAPRVAGGSRVVAPDEVVEEERGDGPTARRVRTYLPDGGLVAGETLNPPGGWSSYPPHRHPAEEVYLYRFEPATGFGVHVSYDGDGDAAEVVRDGSIVRIGAGYHPVVAAPAATMYYLWALAPDAPGDATPSPDPRHA
jgi:5-deoxy-glucuronate isomerase